MDDFRFPPRGEGYTAHHDPKSYEPEAPFDWASYKPGLFRTPVIPTFLLLIAAALGVMGYLFFI